jgi:hypothetical protein
MVLMLHPLMPLGHFGRVVIHLSKEKGKLQFSPFIYWCILISLFIYQIEQCPHYLLKICNLSQPSIFLLNLNRILKKCLKYPYFKQTQPIY